MTARKGLLLEDLTWTEAEKVLTTNTVVVIPLGAAAKEHGPHLPLKNDRVLADKLSEHLAAVADIVIAPTVNYSFYPAFVEYPGSVSLSADTAAKMIEEICLSLHRHGPRKFYVLNTGISTRRILEVAAAELHKHSVLLAYTDLHQALNGIAVQQDGGSHADELETSLMLHLAPELVDMTKAVKDFDNSTAGGPLSRTRKEGAVYSPSGIYGDPTLATARKGEAIVKSLLDHILNDIERLKNSNQVQ